MDPQKTINVIIIISVFGFVLSVWCMGVLLWLGRYLFKLKRVQKRLGISPDPSEKSEVLRLWRDVQMQHEVKHFGLHKKPGIRERINRWMQDIGWDVPFRVVLLSVFGVALFAFIIAYSLTDEFWVGICAVITALYIFTRYFQNRIVKRANLFERQLVDALGITSRALRAGHPLVGAFQLIAEEIEEPLKSVFGGIYHQQAFGSDLRESIRDAARVNRNTEFKLFATAISVQLQSGGNLADLTDSLVSVIRSRMRLNKRVRILTAQTQFSKIILISLPFFMFVLLNTIHPDYMKPLYTTPEGKIMLLAMFVSVLVGAWVMNKLIKVDY